MPERHHLVFPIHKDSLEHRLTGSWNNKYVSNKSFFIVAFQRYVVIFIINIFDGDDAHLLFFLLWDCSGQGIGRGASPPSQQDRTDHSSWSTFFLGSVKIHFFHWYSPISVPKINPPSSQSQPFLVAGLTLFLERVKIQKMAAAALEEKNLCGRK